MLFDILGIAWEQSQALDAAKDAYKQGKSIPDIARAFAAETDNSVDDKIAEEIEDLLTSVAEWAKTTGVATVALSVKLQHNIPIVVKFLRDSADTLEASQPKAEAIGDRVAVTSANIASLAEELLNRK